MKPVLNILYAILGSFSVNLHTLVTWIVTVQSDHTVTSIAVTRGRIGFIRTDAAAASLTSKDFIFLNILTSRERLHFKKEIRTVKLWNANRIQKLSIFFPYICASIFPDVNNIPNLQICGGPVVLCCCCCGLIQTNETWLDKKHTQPVNMACTKLPRFHGELSSTLVDVIKELSLRFKEENQDLAICQGPETYQAIWKKII